MPIEVRELVIKATIVQDAAVGKGASFGSMSSNDVSLNEAMIKICVEKVLEILKEKDER